MRRVLVVDDEPQLLKALEIYLTARQYTVARHAPSSAGDLLRRNLLVYGVGGLVLPFLGIKLIDMAVVQFVPGLG
jgi:high-affinity K+ transport system ATPase subunit B